MSNDLSFLGRCEKTLTWPREDTQSNSTIQVQLDELMNLLDTGDPKAPASPPKSHLSVSGNLLGVS